MADVRLIDANALIELVQKWRNQEAENDNSITGPAIIMALDDVLDAIKTVPTIDSENLRPQWISVKDRFPEIDDIVLAVDDARDCYFAIRLKMAGHEVWVDLDCVEIENVRYWMPLPEPPEVSE